MMWFDCMVQGKASLHRKEYEDYEGKCMLGSRILAIIQHSKLVKDCCKPEEVTSRDQV